MTNPSYQMTALFENRFWLQILGDHARFTFNSLAPTEPQAIYVAQQMMLAFDALLAQARQGLSPEQAITLSQQAWAQACAMRTFQLGLLARQLTGPAGINLPPSLFNHMIDETDEYLRILGYLVAGQLPPAMSSNHYNLVWLDDEIGHAAITGSTLDPAETTYIAESADYLHRFRCLFYKAGAFQGMMRTGLTQFPALSELNTEAYDTTLAFTKFLSDIKEKRTASRLLGTMPPLMPDHMAREQCYYMHKLAISGCLTPPACDPTSPRPGC